MISVDTKKKELVGNFKNSGREWQTQGHPEPVRVHDFEIREPDKGKVAPYGVYDLGRNVGWVSVGVDHDTAAFAVESIRRWWRWMGRPSYPRARRLLITADARGSNGARVRWWKWELQRLADKTGLEISVCHFPPAPASEQDRAPLVLFHQPELAGKTAHQPRGHHQSDGRHYNHDRPEGEKQTRHQRVSRRTQNLRSTDGWASTQER